MAEVAPEMNDITKSIASPSEIMAMERTERNAWLDMYLAVASTLGAGATARWERTHGYAAIAETAIPISELNRCFGLGVDAPLTLSYLDQAIAWLDRHASSNWTIQLPPQDGAGEIAGWLQSRGLERAGTGWARFIRHLEPIRESAVRTGLTVRRLLPAQGAQFGATMVGGFGFAEIAGPWFAALVGWPAWHVYLAFDGDLPVACGVLYADADAGWGWMGCDATLPEYRGRGAQTALIQRRVADASALGLTAVTAETGQPAPGMEHSSHSYRNYHKAGFTKAYVRPNYRRT
jgi:GNAT superfamily N-acetyltransferase